MKKSQYKKAQELARKVVKEKTDNMSLEKLHELIDHIEKGK